MEYEKKKVFMVVVSVVCLVIAGMIIYKSSSRQDAKAGMKIWMKCAECGHTFQIDYKTFEKNFSEEIAIMESTGEQVALSECEECGQNTIYKAMECYKCKTVFIPSDEENRCPECNYSKRKVLLRR